MGAGKAKAEGESGAVELVELAVLVAMAVAAAEAEAVAAAEAEAVAAAEVEAAPFGRL